MIVGVFDYLLSGALICLTFQMMRAKDLLTSIVLFIIFGMLIALAWVQLQAPDIALVEAVIGAALTGVLFLGCLGYIESAGEKAVAVKKNKKLLFKLGDLLLSMLTIGAGVLFTWTVLKFDKNEVGMTDQVANVLTKSGVDNPVTAVILNIRGYDTFLEIGVLFLVVIAVYSLHAMRPILVNFCLNRQSRILGVFLYVLAPLMVLVAFYLLWAGGHAPGGAFQAGAMLAGVGILLFIAGIPISLSVENIFWRFICSVGFGGFLLVGLAFIFIERNFLEYPEKYAKYFIFFIELLSTFSIAAILLTLFAGCAGFLITAKDESFTKGLNK